MRCLAVPLLELLGLGLQLVQVLVVFVLRQLLQLLLQVVQLAPVYLLK